jgi:hypothetical protein
MIGHQVDEVTAAAQLLRQRRGREEMSSRPSRNQNESAHSAGTGGALGLKLGKPVAMRSSGRFRVSASISPMPKAMAMVEVPP